ncbi:ABC transporter permease [Streptomyces virginiae]|uniref:ABC transporter permease n=1 Tax=Streptomyces virginiae TaxID=1961 RepID=UPI002DD96457|nr:ABC transporter permease [Streptomyces virginiae]WSC82678.1 ABC transporter permease [Streptomyces virginiae]
MRATWVFTVASLSVNARAVSALESPCPIKAVWDSPLLAGLPAAAGVAIAVLGALVPARSAARMTIASALHTE